MAYADSVPTDFSTRDYRPGLAEAITGRWSPRAMKKTALPDSDIALLFEAARWAPSCMNEQPWLFFVSTDDSFEDYLSYLLPGNQIWAKNASLLCYLACQTNYASTGLPNAHAFFDAGAAWMALTFQARAMGLYTHGMAGIDFDGAAKFLKLKEDEKLICAMAIGVIDKAETLPDALKEREKPSGRKKLEEMLWLGKRD